MDSFARQLAHHVLTELNKLGIVKESQVNSTTTGVVGGFIEAYMTASNIEFTSRVK